MKGSGHSWATGLGQWGMIRGEGFRVVKSASHLALLLSRLFVSGVAFLLLGG